MARVDNIRSTDFASRRCNPLVETSYKSGFKGAKLGSQFMRQDYADFS